jgi:hypothetical protein
MLHFSAVRNFSSHPRAFKSFGSTSLTRIAKHLALLACFMVIGAATGRPVLGQLGIFILVVFIKGFFCVLLPTARPELFL